MIFNKNKAKAQLDIAIQKNSELDLLSVLKENSFLFYDLYSRHYGIQPNFAEISFGRKHRCDFCWLNDNSDGPEWVLVEIEKPKIKLFNGKGDPSSDLNHAVEQVRSWDRYFHTNPLEKNRIFGAVSRFRYVLVIGGKEDWNDRHAAVWKSHFNDSGKIEIRSMDTFEKSLIRFNEDPSNLSFEQHPKSLKSRELSQYCNDYAYIQSWKNILTSNT